MSGNAPKWAAGDLFADKYRLEENVLNGPFSNTWRALQVSDQQLVSVKVLRHEFMGSPEAIKRFVREVRILARWKHPNLLRVLAAGRCKTVPYIVSEYIEGRPLSDEIVTLMLGIDEITHIAGQIARVLAGAHARGIVHRGLCPDAVYLVEERGDLFRVKMMDFGLAHIDDTGGEQLTAVRQRLGKAEYWSPEYIAAFHLDSRSDLYVLGVLAFEMLCAQPPFVGSTRAVVNHHLETEPRAPSELSPLEVPAWLDAVVLALLQKEPEDRPQDALTVATAFRDQQWPPPPKSSGGP